jgi:hypothetical protein
MGSQSEYTKEEMDFINKKLEAIARVAARTEKEICSIFTEKEISYVNEIWRGIENPNGMTSRNLILYKIVHSIHEEVLRIKWNVNRDAISQKINDLNDYQAFTLIRVAVQQRRR